MEKVRRPRKGKDLGGNQGSAKTAAKNQRSRFDTLKETNGANENQGENQQGSHDNAEIEESQRNARRWLTGSQMRKNKGKAIAEEPRGNIPRNFDGVGRTMGRMSSKGGKENDINRANVRGSSSRIVDQRENSNKTAVVG